MKSKKLFRKAKGQKSKKKCSSNIKMQSLTSIWLKKENKKSDIEARENIGQHYTIIKDQKDKIDVKRSKKLSQSEKILGGQRDKIDEAKQRSRFSNGR